MVRESSDQPSAGLVTVPEAAQILGMSEQGILKRIKRKAMRAERLGGKVWVIPREEVERWRALGREKPGRKPRGDAGEPAKRASPPDSDSLSGDGATQDRS